jgi:hypothetical protein
MPLEDNEHENSSPEPSGKNLSSSHEGKWRDNIKLVLEISGLLILLIYTVFSGLQWAQIRLTNRLTKEALGDNSQSLNQTLGKMQLQADAMNRLASAEETANLNALASDRPWIGGWIQVKGFAAGESPEANCTFINAGKRPALLDRTNCRIVMDKYDLNTIRDEPEKPGRSVLVPGQTTITPIHFFRGGSPSFISSENKMTSALIDAFNSGDVHIKVFGTAAYRDAKTGERHLTHSCMRYLPSMYGRAAGFYECESGNDAN